jgi:copper chaperone CopZ
LGYNNGGLMKKNDVIEALQKIEGNPEVKISYTENVQLSEVTWDTDTIWSDFEIIDLEGTVILEAEE